MQATRHENKIGERCIVPENKKKKNTTIMLQAKQRKKYLLYQQINGNFLPQHCSFIPLLAFLSISEVDPGGQLRSQE